MLITITHEEIEAAVREYVEKRMQYYGVRSIVLYGAAVDQALSAEVVVESTGGDR